MNFKLLIAATTTVIALASGAAAQLADLYVTNAEGDVFYVDGTSLQGTAVFTVEDTWAINDLAYAGSNNLLYNSGHSIVQRDINTGTESTVIEFATEFDGFFHSDGISLTADGNIVCNIVQFGPDGLSSSMITIDGNIHTYSDAEMAETRSFFDHHSLGNNIFLGATYTQGEVLFTNAATGVIEDRFTTDVDVVSFYESSQGIFAMTINGELHSVDLQSRSLDFYGQITGTNGSLIGATIPTPSTLAILGSTLLISTRRRRCI